MNSRPGFGLIHPVVVLAVVVLAVNDHWAKQRWPGLITGKLSDVAGLAFFPLFLQAGWELFASLRGPVVPSFRVARNAAILTAVVFSAVKLFEPASLAYEWGLGLLRWPLDLTLRPVSLTRDPTDLLALPALAISLLLARRRAHFGLRARFFTMDS